MMQPTTPPTGPPKRKLSETVWTKLDRKATAIAEFTMRQYRKKRSTWAIGGVGLILIVIVLLFYIEAMSTGIESWDNDDDGMIDEDGSDWEVWQSDEFASRSVSGPMSDDDGDCMALDPFLRDDNGDGIDCNVVYIFNSKGELTSIEADSNVDEDPNESEFLEEAMHRSFIIGFGKFGYLFVLGMFIPMFLATGLIRGEQEAGTLHYLVGKPIARAEILMYRVLGFLGLAWPYFIGLIFLSALVTGIFGPGDSVFRFSDLGIWFGVLIATFFTVMTYSIVFVTFGLVGPRFGYVAVFLLAVFELFMMLVGTAGSGSSVRVKALTSMSISFWGTEIINSTAWMVWGDYAYMNGQALLVGPYAEISLWAVWGTPFPTTSPVANFIISILVLTFVSALFVLMGQSAFKKRELN
jgi:ABC-type transport system involved in multi-copper enzyme maturation permease subunit